MVHETIQEVQPQQGSARFSGIKPSLYEHFRQQLYCLVSISYQEFVNLDN